MITFIIEVIYLYRFLFRHNFAFLHYNLTYQVLISTSCRRMEIHCLLLYPARCYQPFIKQGVIPNKVSIIRNKCTTWRRVEQLPPQNTLISDYGHLEMLAEVMS